MKNGIAFASMFSSFSRHEGNIAVGVSIRICHSLNSIVDKPPIVSFLNGQPRKQAPIMTRRSFADNQINYKTALNRSATFHFLRATGFLFRIAAIWRKSVNNHNRFGPSDGEESKRPIAPAISELIFIESHAKRQLRLFRIISADLAERFRAASTGVQSLFLVHRIAMRRHIAKSPTVRVAP